MIAQHRSETNEHYTPADIVERARVTLGEIDLDPASCGIAQSVVDASIAWGEPDGVLGRFWGLDGSPMRVFLNPPGGKLDPDTFGPFIVGKLRPNGKKCSAADGISSVSVWWAKLWSEWNIGNVQSAVFVCFSLAIFRTAQEFSPEVPPPFMFPFCVPSARINYDKAAPFSHERVPTKGAPADSALILIPPKDEIDARKTPTINRFVEQFSPLGVVRL